MNKYGQSYIGGKWVLGSGEPFQSWDPVNNEPLYDCSSCGESDIDAAMIAASHAVIELERKSNEDLAEFLKSISEAIVSLESELVRVAQAETGLDSLRLSGELKRTTGQINAFAETVAEGSWVDASIDTPVPDRTPLPKPDVRSMYRPVGPVVIFGASNFPFAFGTVGGDTASAIASGNPVVVKGHPSHPATSTLFAMAVESAIEKCEFPSGTFTLLQGETVELGSALVAHPLTASVGFTGSLNGGRALMDIAAARPKPITVYAEMGSINPVFLLPDALEANGEQIASGLASSISVGAGQFCTSPGLNVTFDRDFGSRIAEQLSAQPTGYMLNRNIAQSMSNSLKKRAEDSQIVLLTGGDSKQNVLAPNNTLLQTSGKHFMQSPALLEEIFGPVSLVVVCESKGELLDVANYMEGNLTATIHAEDYGDGTAAELLEILSWKAGRVLFNGYPTGVEVCPSMNHGGAYPASSMPATTSVGSRAITRFARRAAYQNCPDNLLPPALQDLNPLNIWREIDGSFTRSPVTPKS